MEIQSRMTTPALALLMAFFSVLLLLVGSTGTSLGLDCESESGKQQVLVYFLIDGSGSMLRRDDQEETRWERTIAWAKEQVSFFELGTAVSIGVFEGRKIRDDGSVGKLSIQQKPFSLGNEEDRANLVDYLDQLATESPPVNGASTALYDATAWVFDQALSEINKGSLVSVIVLSDGQDSGYEESTKKNETGEMQTGSRSFGSDVFTIPRYATVFSRGESPAMTFVYSGFAEGTKSPFLGDPTEGEGNKGNPDLPLVLRLHPTQFVLGDPAAVSNRKATLEFCLSIPGYRSEEIIGSETPNIELVYPFPPPGAPKLSGPKSIPFNEGEIRIPIEVLNPGEVEAGKSHEVEIGLQFPAKISGKWVPRVADRSASEVSAGNQATLNLLFRTGETPVIQSMGPEDGSAFPADQNVEFWVATEPEMNVTWNVAGENRSDIRFEKAFSEGGKQQASVTVTDPKTSREVTASMEFEILNHLVEVEDPAQKNERIVAGEPFTFLAKSRGDIERFDWYVDGMKMPGKLREDGQPGSRMTYTFDEDLEHSGQSIRVEAKARGRDYTVFSDPVPINVRLRPVARLVSPATGEAYYGKKLKTRIRVSGDDVVKADVEIQREDGTSIHEVKDVPVNYEPGRESTSFELEFDPVEGAGKQQDLSISAKLKTEDGTATGPFTYALKLRSRPPEALALTFPGLGENRSVQSGDMVQMKLSCKDESDLRGATVKWDIEGMVGNKEPTSLNPSRMIKGDGDVNIEATVILPDGEVLPSVSETLTLVPQPISVKPSLLRGGRKVAPGSTVWLRDTLSLTNESTGELSGEKWTIGRVEEENDEEILDINAIEGDLLTVGNRGWNVVGLQMSDGNGGIHSAEVRFRSRSLPRAAVLIVLALALFGFAAYVFLIGNGPALSVIEVRKGDINSGYLGQEKVMGRWSPLLKRTVIPLKKFATIERDPWLQRQGDQDHILTINRSGIGGLRRGMLRMKGGTNDDSSIDYKLKMPRLPNEAEVEALGVRNRRDRQSLAERAGGGPESMGGSEEGPRRGRPNPDLGAAQKTTYWLKHKSPPGWPWRYVVIWIAITAILALLSFFGWTHLV